MERRSFLKGLAGLIGGVALEQAIPFGRVWSFPQNIVIAKPITSVGQAIGMMHEFIRPNLPLLYRGINPSFNGRMIAKYGLTRTHFGIKEKSYGEISLSS
jgi:hypothetical protein